MFYWKSLFILELECGKMENRIITKSLNKQLDQIMVHEQVENGVVINNNLSEDQIDQQFVTPKINFHLK